jgi:hypothetical protein
VQYSARFEQLIPGYRQLAAQIKEFVLNHNQQFAHIIGQRFGQQHAQTRVEFVHLAHGVNTYVVFADTAAITEAGAAVVACSGGYLCESIGHAGMLTAVSTLNPGVRAGGFFFVGTLKCAPLNQPYCFMKSLLIISALSLSVCSAFANDNKSIKPLLGFGLTGGGETLVSTRFTNGDSASIRSGGLVSFIGGAEFRVANNIAVQTTMGYHVDRVNAANGSIRFERFPLSVTGLYSINPQVRLGLGLEHVSNPKIRGTGVAGSVSENFKSSTGQSFPIQV